MIPAQFQHLTDSFIRLLSDSSEYLALAAGGSWIDNQLDQFSDLDLVIVHQSATLPISERQALAEAAGDLLACFTGEHVGEPRLLICLYDQPLLHVDLKFVHLADMAHRVEDPVIIWERDGQLSQLMATTTARFPHPDPQWIEDRFWVWIHYAATKIGRGELFETLTFLSFMQQQVLGPLSLIQHGLLPKGVRKIEFLLPEEDQQALRRTVANYDRRSCLEALQQVVASYRSLRSALATPTLISRDRAEERAVAYLNALV